ncbi:HutD/Ves family protein [Lampropedia cohaerens]|uniref:HutD/Ves family protein n=1 Tax=Lampropedia cohaerens TaxID=1610491 RepID=UPI00069CAAFC|nr:HutD family protein [Lampropedia cohaerens]
MPETRTIETINHFNLTQLPLQPWQNGGGKTREILAWPASSQWQWRISLAENTQAGAFSELPGVDRTAMLFEGGPLQLLDATGQVVFNFDKPGALRSFAGELPLRSQRPQAPAQLLNVMTRRGQARAEVVWHGDRSGTFVLQKHSDCVLLAARGSWQVSLQPHDSAALSASYILKERCGLRIRGAQGRVRLQSTQAEGALAQVVLEPLNKP